MTARDLQQIGAVHARRGYAHQDLSGRRDRHGQIHRNEPAPCDPDRRHR